MNKLLTTFFLIFFSLVLYSQIVFCEDKEVTLELSNDFIGYNWSSSLSSIDEDGSLYINQVGEYLIQVDLDYLGCVYQFKRIVMVDSCDEFTIYFPTAMVPEGSNITWFPVFKNVKIESLVIYDRWGSTVWQWNGIEPFKGLNQQGNPIDGVFTYSCFYSDLNSRKYSTIGRVTVIR